MSLTKVSSAVLNVDDLYGFRNRIINGDMRIDQRNAGAAVTGGATFPVDRFTTVFAGAGAFTAQRSTDAPSGFTNSLLYTVTTPGDATTTVRPEQRIEGFNTADFGWGTAAAQPVTVSFWVKSSVTGTYTVRLRNHVPDRIYLATYTINAANTWEQKNITVPGDTTGTWLTDNSVGLAVGFALALGTLSAGNVWGTTGAAATGQVNFMATNGATFYVTGVQLEKGTVATPFERRPFGTELALCQRYYYKVAPGVADSILGFGYCGTTTTALALTNFPVTMRVAPTALEQSGTASDYVINHPGLGNVTCSAVPTFTARTNQYMAQSIFTVASGLTEGFGAGARAITANAFLAWSVEL